MRIPAGTGGQRVPNFIVISRLAEPANGPLLILDITNLWHWDDTYKYGLRIVFVLVGVD
jgi:hypothetical protein